MTQRANIGHLPRLGAWLAGYAVIAPLAWLARAPRRVQTAVVGAAVVAACVIAGPSSCRQDRLRIATFNIENFGAPDKRTDDSRITELIAELDADVIAVQEIQDPARFAVLVAGIATPGRRYQFVPSRCGGNSKWHDPMHVGFVLDVAHVRLMTTQEFPELAPTPDEGCGFQDRPGLLGEFIAAGRRFDLLVVHFAAKPEQAPKRRDQWDRALAIVAGRRAAGVPVAIIGDVNSTGFLDDAQEERAYIRQRLAAARMTLPTEMIGCSEYFQRDGRGPYRRSLLDHVALCDRFPIEPHAEVHGYCRELACPAHLDSLPRDFNTVSDHCPVTIGR